MVKKSKQENILILKPWSPLLHAVLKNATNIVEIWQLDEIWPVEK